MFSNLHKKEKKLSVIVAAYNQEKYIGRCLRSLLNQTMDPDSYEIIVIDDGSQDRTSYALELLCDTTNSVTKVITNKENYGLPASLNKGIIASESEYIVRVDSDDFVNTNFLNFLYMYLETNTEANAVACDYLLIDDNEKIIARRNCMEDPIACGILFRKQCVINAGLYDKNFRWKEDQEFRIRFEKLYTINRLEIPLYRYRRHDNNITNNLEQMNLHENNLIKKHGLNPKN